MPDPPQTPPGGLMFAACCASPGESNQKYSNTYNTNNNNQLQYEASSPRQLYESSPSTSTSSHTYNNVPSNGSPTSKYIRRLLEAEAEGTALITQARLKGRQSFQRAQTEAREEMNRYEEQFRIEFEKLKLKNDEEVDLFYEDIKNQTRKEIQKDLKKSSKAKNEAVYFLHDKTCQVDLRIPDTAAALLHRQCGGYPDAAQSEASRRFYHYDALELGRCPKHKTSPNGHQHNNNHQSYQENMQSQQTDTNRSVSPSSGNRNSSRRRNDNKQTYSVVIEEQQNHDGNGKYRQTDSADRLDEMPRGHSPNKAHSQKGKPPTSKNRGGEVRSQPGGKNDEPESVKRKQKNASSTRQTSKLSSHSVGTSSASNSF